MNKYLLLILIFLLIASGCRITNVCGDGILDPDENYENCCIDAGCPDETYECIDNSCVKKGYCGDEFIDPDENYENCCIDAGCPDETYECIDNSCVKKQDSISLGVVLLKYQDMTGTPPSIDTIQNRYIATMRDFWDADTYGNVKIGEAEIFGWFTIPSDCETMSAPYDSKVQNILEENNIDMEKYDKKIYMYYSDCTHGGRQLGDSMTVGFDDVTLEKRAKYVEEWNLLDKTLNHEFGHSLGLGHSKLLICEDGVLQGNCRLAPYSNYLDIMGEGGKLIESCGPFSCITSENSIHTNAAQKYQVGWLKDEDVLDIDSSGTYQIGTLMEDNEYPRAAKFSVGNKDYMIEWRKPIGFDKGIVDTINSDGLVINKIDKIEYLSETMLLDFEDGSKFDIANVALTDSFSEEAAGFSINNIQVNDDYVEFYIEFSEPVCFPSSMLISFQYVHKTNNDPTKKVYVAEIKFENINPYTCADSTIEYNLDLPSGWEKTAKIKYCQRIDGRGKTCIETKDRKISPDSYGKLEIEIEIPNDLFESKNFQLDLIDSTYEKTGIAHIYIY